MARKFLYIIAAIIVLVLLVSAALQLFPKQLSQLAFVPGGEFVTQEKVEPTGYANPDLWFARPGKNFSQIGDDPTAWVPEGFAVAEKPKVAVFYVHPTSYLRSTSWNAPLDDTESQDRAKIFLRSQASAFNGIASIWAPRYRQATLGAFLTDRPEAQMAFDAAYADVEAAFDEFVRAIPAGTPVIIAGHSQGAMLITYLLQNRVKDAPIARWLVATYIVGWPVSLDNDLAAMGVEACAAPDQTGCALSWMSFGEPADTSLITEVYDRSTGFDGEPRLGHKMLCSNPITGLPDTEASASDNPGTLVPDADLKSGNIVPGFVGARCDARGFLLLGGEPAMGSYVLPGNNYHVYDYPLFWASIRADAERRVAAFKPR